MEKKEINILIPLLSGAEILAHEILILKENQIDFPIVKIGTNFRVFHLLDEKQLFDCINNIQRFPNKVFREFPEFSGNEKFDYIVIDASESHNHGIDYFPSSTFLKSILKEDGEIIIDICMACINCNITVQNKYRSLSPKMKNDDINSGSMPIVNYILGQIDSQEK